jgi:ribosomal protein L40E
MSKAHLLAKLTPHGVTITGEGFGGHARLDAMDVAGALGMGGLDWRAYKFGLLKYCGDHLSLRPLDDAMRVAIAEQSRAGRWNLTAEQISGLASLAIIENLHDRICDRCNGSGTVAAKECDKCHGTGKLPMSERRRAEIVGVPESSWRRLWKPRAAWAYAVVQQWDADVTAHLSRQFGSRESYEVA